MCAQTNIDGDRVRFELLLKSNRNTAQAITIPVADKDYVWVENQPGIVRDLLAAIAGVEPGGVALLGGGQLSMGFVQPAADSSFVLRRYSTNTLAVLNPLLALLGRAPIEDVMLAYAAAATKCGAEIAGVDLFSLDAVPNDFIDGPEALKDLVVCAIELLQEPRLVADILSELLIAADVGDAAYRTDLVVGITDRLKGVASVAKAIANAVAVVGSLGQLWDVIFDGLSEGQLTVSLAGPSRPPAQPDPAPVPSPMNCPAPDVDAYAQVVYDSWNARDLSLVEECVPTTSDALSALEGILNEEVFSPLVTLAPCEFRMTGAGYEAIECWVRNDVGQTYVFEFNAGSAGEILTYVHFVGGGM